VPPKKKKKGEFFVAAKYEETDWDTTKQESREGFNLNGAMSNPKTASEDKFGTYAQRDLSRFKKGHEGWRALMWNLEQVGKVDLVWTSRKEQNTLREARRSSRASVGLDSGKKKKVAGGDIFRCRVPWGTSVKT